MHSVVFYITLVAFNLLPFLLEGGCTACGKNRNNAIIIDSLPYTIKNSGLYVLRPHIEIKSHDDTTPLVSIESNDVRLDLFGNTLDLGGTQGSAIIVHDYRGIEIFNGQIAHSGIPDFESDSFQSPKIKKSEPLSPHQLDLLDSITHQPEAYRSPFGSSSISCAGIKIMAGSKYVLVQNITFKEVFVGIACIDNVENITIRNCKGLECGGLSRGGFIAIAPSSFSIYSTSKNISISNCTSHTQKGQFGLALFNSKNSQVQNCVFHVESNDSAGDTFSASAGLNAVLCKGCLFESVMDHNNLGCIKAFFCENCSY